METIKTKAKPFNKYSDPSLSSLVKTEDCSAKHLTQYFNNQMAA